VVGLILAVHPLVPASDLGEARVIRKAAPIERVPVIRTSIGAPQTFKKVDHVVVQLTNLRRIAFYGHRKNRPRIQFPPLTGSYELTDQQ
jgi:hypothetical protein